MIEDLPDVPPALLLMARELSSCESPVEMRRRVKGMLRELRDQSETFEIQNFERRNEPTNPLHFEIHLDGALDLLSKKGCQALRCRVAAANRIARSVGLIADRVWLTDLLTEKFIDFGRPTNAKLDDVIEDFIVLAQLFPLILAGIVRFRSPWIPTCKSCAEHFAHEVEVTAKDLFNMFNSEFRVKKLPGGGFTASTGRCIEPPLIQRSISRDIKRAPSTRKFAEYWIRNQVRGALWAAREASKTGGSVFSNPVSDSPASFTTTAVMLIYKRFYCWTKSANFLRLGLAIWMQSKSYNYARKHRPPYQHFANRWQRLCVFQAMTPFHRRSQVA